MAKPLEFYRGTRRTGIFRKILLCLGLAFAGFLFCGEPYGYLPRSWVDIGVIPFGEPGDGFKTGVGGPDGFYYLSVFRQRNKVFKYANGRFGEEHVWPEGVELNDINFLGDEGWVGGTYPDTSRPFLAKKSHAGWREVDLNDADFLSVEKVFPAVDGLWLIVKSQRDNYFTWFSGVVVEEFPDTGGVDAATYVPATRTLFGLRIFKEPNGPRLDHPYLLISADGGLTWKKEDFGFVYYGTEVNLHPLIKSDGGATFFLAEYLTEEHGYYQIIRRTGRPGEGEYELSYMSYLGPHLEDLIDIAFRSPYDGMGVGWKASLSYDGVYWVQEDVGDALLIRVFADPNGGYWGVMLSEDHAAHLLRHP